MDHETTSRLLDQHLCYEHEFPDGWEEDIDRDDYGRRTETKVCVNCGYTVTRPLKERISEVEDADSD